MIRKQKRAQNLFQKAIFPVTGISHFSFPDFLSCQTNKLTPHFVFLFFFAYCLDTSHLKSDNIEGVGEEGQGRAEILFKPEQVGGGENKTK